MYAIMIALTLCLPGNAPHAKKITPLKSHAQKKLKSKIKKKSTFPIQITKSKIKTKDVAITDKDLKLHAKINKELGKRRNEHLKALEKFIVSKMDKKKFKQMSELNGRELNKAFTKKDILNFNSLKSEIKTKQTSFNQEITNYLYKGAALSLIRFKQISRVLQINNKFKERYEKLNSVK